VHARRKIVVVGAGAVGSTFAYSLAQSGLVEEIALVDRNQSLVRGQVMDLAHGKPFFPTVSIHEGDASDYADAQVIVLTAGAPQKPGQTRLELVRSNARVVRAVVQDVVAHNSPAVLLVVSNPVDVMTHVAVRCAGWDKGRIFGSGTVLDSARLRYLLSSHCRVDVHNVHAYVLGEHGDSEFAAWSMTHLAGLSIDRYCPVCGRCRDWQAELSRIEQQVRDSAYHVIDYKGATCFAVGLALVRIVAAVLRGQNSLLTVSAPLDGEFGLKEVSLSVPSLVSSGGVKEIVPVPLPVRELSALHASAAVIRQALEQLDAEGDSPPE